MKNTKLLPHPSSFQINFILSFVHFHTLDTTVHVCNTHRLGFFWSVDVCVCAVGAVLIHSHTLCNGNSQSLRRHEAKQDFSSILIVLSWTKQTVWPASWALPGWLLAALSCSGACESGWASDGGLGCAAGVCVGVPPSRASRRLRIWNKNQTKCSWVLVYA